MMGNRLVTEWSESYVVHVNSLECVRSNISKTLPTLTTNVKTMW